MTNLDGANSEPKKLNTIYFEKDLEMIYHLFMQPVRINIKRGPQNDHSCEVWSIPSKSFIGDVKVTMVKDNRPHMTMDNRKRLVTIAQDEGDNTKDKGT